VDVKHLYASVFANVDFDWSVKSHRNGREAFGAGSTPQGIIR
jgi:hypothetical protein